MEITVGYLYENAQIACSTCFHNWDAEARKAKQPFYPIAAGKPVAELSCDTCGVKL